jgi:hypothetical protein
MAFRANGNVNGQPTQRKNKKGFKQKQENDKNPIFNI